MVGCQGDVISCGWLSRRCDMLWLIASVNQLLKLYVRSMNNIRIFCENPDNRRHRVCRTGEERRIHKGKVGGYVMVIHHRITRMELVLSVGQHCHRFLEIENTKKVMLKLESFY